MKISTLFCLLCFVVFPLSTSIGQEKIQKTFNYKDYKTAKKAESYVRFKLKHTKIGLFSSYFSSYVKNFQIQGSKLKDESAENLSLNFSILAMDTNKNKRDKKMRSYCLDYPKQQKIEVKIKQKIPFGSFQNIPGQIFIRGQWKNIMVKIKITQKDQTYKVEGSTLLSLKKLEIPDPSIAVATLDDRILIDFAIISD